MNLVCQVYLALLSTYHLASGVLSFFFGEAALRFYKAFYGTDPVERRHLLLILKPWGALSICVGLAGWSAVPDPTRHRGVVLAILVLLLLRITYRVAQHRELTKHRIHPRAWWIFGGVTLAVGSLLALTVAARALHRRHRLATAPEPRYFPTVVVDERFGGPFGGGVIAEVSFRAPAPAENS